MKEKLEPLGYEVIDIHDKGYQFRINNAIDVYPKSQRFFDLKTKEWGFYSMYADVIDFLKDRLDDTYIENRGVEEWLPDLKKQELAETIIQNIERRLESKKIMARPRQIIFEEIIKLL